MQLTDTIQMFELREYVERFPFQAIRESYEYNAERGQGTRSAGCRAIAESSLEASPPRGRGEERREQREAEGVRRRAGGASERDGRGGASRRHRYVIAILLRDWLSSSSLLPNMGQRLHS